MSGSYHLCTATVADASPEAGERGTRAVGEGTVGEQPPWNPYGQQQDPRQGQPQYPQQHPYGYQPLPYGQQSRQPSHMPDPQYVPQSGEPPYQGHSYQGQLPYGPPGSQPPPYPGPGYGS